MVHRPGISRRAHQGRGRPHIARFVRIAAREALAHRADELHHRRAAAHGREQRWRVVEREHRRAVGRAGLGRAPVVRPDGEASGGGKTYWLGTDDQGRDMLSGIFYGLRISLGVGVASTLVALAVGLVFGLVAAYFGGWVDTLVMRIVDIQLSFPPVFIAPVPPGAARWKRLEMSSFTGLVKPAG